MNPEKGIRDRIKRKVESLLRLIGFKLETEADESPQTKVNPAHSFPLQPVRETMPEDITAIKPAFEHIAPLQSQGFFEEVRIRFESLKNINTKDEMGKHLKQYGSGLRLNDLSKVVNLLSPTIFNEPDFEEWQNVLRGKKILDLGCGSEFKTKLYGNRFGYSPIIARYSTLLGANVTGIDYLPSALASDEIYSHVQADLTRERLLDILQISSQKFDLITSTRFIEATNVAPLFSEKIPRKAMYPDEMRTNFVDDAKHLLNEGGRLDVGDIYELKNGELHKIFDLSSGRYIPIPS